MIGKVKVTSSAPKCGRHLYEKFPGSKTKMKRKELRQGMSNEPRLKVDRLIQVRCFHCLRVTWLEESEYENQLSKTSQSVKNLALLGEATA